MARMERMMERILEHSLCSWTRCPPVLEEPVVPEETQEKLQNVVSKCGDGRVLATLGEMDFDAFPILPHRTGVAENVPRSGTYRTMDVI